MSYQMSYPPPPSWRLLCALILLGVVLGVVLRFGFGLRLICEVG